MVGGTCFPCIQHNGGRPCYTGAATLPASGFRLWQALKRSGKRPPPDLPAVRGRQAACTCCGPADTRIATALLSLPSPSKFSVLFSSLSNSIFLRAGLLGYGSQVTMTMALRRVKAAPATAMSYLAIVWGILAVLLFHSQRLELRTVLSRQNFDRTEPARHMRPPSFCASVNCLSNCSCARPQASVLPHRTIGCAGSLQDVLGADERGAQTAALVHPRKY